MTFNQQTITGVLRKWRREPSGAIHGYVYESEIWDYGEPCLLTDGSMIESVHFYLYTMGRQVFKLPKDEEIKDVGGDAGAPRG